MKYVYIMLVNMCLFFFLSALFAQILIVGQNTQFSDLLLAGLLFGILWALAPNVLEFMKIKGSAWALVLIGIVLTFIFFFVGYYVFDLFNIIPGNVILNQEIKLIEVKDQTFGLILISMVSSMASVLLQILSKKN